MEKKRKDQFSKWNRKEKINFQEDTWSKITWAKLNAKEKKRSLFKRIHGAVAM